MKVAEPEPPKEEAAEQAQLSFFGETTEKETKKPLKGKEMKAIEELKSLSILEMTPLEAMNALYALQKKVK